MDILENSIYNSVNGFVISENTYINKGKIYKVYTDEFGFISIYTKNSEMFLSLYSNYNFKLMYKNEFFYCNEYELIDFYKFKSKDQILFLNILSEIIVKTNVQELKNLEVYNLIGYHIIFENNKYLDYYNFDISELLINSNLKMHIKYNYLINNFEYNYIYLLYHSDSIRNFETIDFKVNKERILGLLVNALCLNFNVYRLNSYNLR